MTPKQRQELWQIIADVRDSAPRLPDDASTDDVIDAIIDSGWLERLTPKVRQYGVQIVWKDPVKAGAVKKGEPYEPAWSVFSDQERAENFAAYYHDYLWAGSHNGVKAVNCAERWASEQYGEWDPV